MACTAMAEREEGELSEAEDLSDISSEEEYLLRQRLHVLETYNNVLERKEAKRRSVVSEGKKSNDVLPPNVLLPDLSDISGSELEGNIKIQITNDMVTKKVTKKPKTLKSARKRNHERNHNSVKRNYEKLPQRDALIKKNSRKNDAKSPKDKQRKKHETKKILDSSDESDYEYRNKRRRLQNAVNITNTKTDYTTLKTRLMNMFTDKTNAIVDVNSCSKIHKDELVITQSVEPCSIKEKSSLDIVDVKAEEEKNKTEEITDIVSLSTDEDEAPKSKNDSSYEIINIGSVESYKCLEDGTNSIMNDSSYEIINVESVESNECHEPGNSIMNGSRYKMMNIESVESNKCHEDGSKSIMNDSSYEIINIGSVESNKCHEAGSNSIIDVNSDEDLELLRQDALKTKSVKKQTADQPAHPNSESEDSDTAELRLICLRSTLLKKAMEMKQKKKMRKRIATLSSIDDLLMSKLDALSDQTSERSHGNTDIESVDMDTGISDGSNMDDNVFKVNDMQCERVNSESKENMVHNIITEKQLKPGKVMETRLGIRKKMESQLDTENMINRLNIGTVKEVNVEVESVFEPHLETVRNAEKKLENQNESEKNKSNSVLVPVKSKDLTKDEDMEEDEDLLRAKLLNSLTHNLHKLCKNDDKLKEETMKPSNNLDNKNQKNKENTEEITKRFVINIGDSDSGSDNETTKNLKKMHMKLSENNDFEQRLDLFLKSARKEAEKTAPIDKEKATVLPQSSPEKFVPKALKHLPKSGQLEYKRLVKRMAELEKLKQARQATLNRTPKTVTTANTENIMKITLKPNEPRSVTEGTKNTVKINQVKLAQDLETEIALSRKRIAAESAKVLQLKEESNKLLQRYKMVVTELRNVRTAMIFNKKEVNTVQASLAKMRSQHQLLLNRTTSLSSSKVVNSASYGKMYIKPDVPASDGDREGVKDNLKNASVLQSVKVSIVNDRQEIKKIPEKNISVQLDLSKNRKTVTLPKEKSPPKDSILHYGEKENHEPAPAVDVLQNQCTLETDVARIVSKSVGVSDTGVKTDKEIEQIEAKSSSRENITITKISHCESNIQNSKSELNDYKSPLVSMVSDVSWNEDPHGVLCPYEVGGSCKDSECKYLHARPTRH